MPVLCAVGRAYILIILESFCLLLGDKYSHQNKASAFRSLGKTKFHSKPKMSVSLTELKYEHPETDRGVVVSPVTSQSVECLLEPTQGNNKVCHKYIYIHTIYIPCVTLW